MNLWDICEVSCVVKSSNRNNAPFKICPHLISAIRESVTPSASDCLELTSRLNFQEPL